MTGEFAAIAALRAGLAEPDDPGQVWIGDDAAVLTLPELAAGSFLLLSADAVVAGVHADLRLTTLADLGWKAVAAAVSDIAAMGGEARHAVVSVAGPAGTDLEQLYEGIGEAAREFRCPIVGGDLANAPGLVVNVAVTGTCAGPPVRRSGAVAGNEIWVTGPLGASAAGLRVYRSGHRAAVDSPLRAAHARPIARLAEGRAARLAGATAMIDVSDGAAADVAHIAAGSRVGAALDALPVAAGATLQEAIGGGEDYELVFCTPAGLDPRPDFSAAGLRTPVRIGVCTASAGVLTLAGEPLGAEGWQHTW